MPEMQNGVWRRRPEETPPAWRTENAGPWHLHTDGFYYRISPFDPDPWFEFAGNKLPAVVLPPGFEPIFGPKPEMKNFRLASEFDIALVDWERALGQFERAGTPPWATVEGIDATNKILRFWGLGDAIFYKLTHSEWLATFANWRATNASAWTVLYNPHLAVCDFQITVYQNAGKVPPQGWHPYLQRELAGEHTG